MKGKGHLIFRLIFIPLDDAEIYMETHIISSLNNTEF